MKVRGIKDSYGKDVDVMMAPIGSTYLITYRPNGRETVTYPIETLRKWLNRLETSGVTEVAIDVLG